MHENIFISKCGNILESNRSAHKLIVNVLEEGLHRANWTYF